MKKTKKKKIFFHSGAIDPIFATELELINEFLNRGEEIIFINGIENIDTCYWNIDNFKPFCKVSTSKFQNGINNLENKDNLEILQFRSKDFTIDSKKLNTLKNIKNLKKFTYDQSPLGYGIASSMQTLLKDHEPDLNKYKNLLERNIKTSIKIHKYIKNLLIKKKPSELYIFNGRIAESWPIVCLAKKFKINYFTYEVANLKKNTYQTYKNILPHLIQTKLKIPKNYKNKNFNNKIKLTREFVLKEKKLMNNLTFKNFSKTFEKDKLPANFDKNLRNICIFNSSIEESNSIKDLPLDIYENSNDAIFKILRDFKNNSNFLFYLRLHPNLSKKNFLSENFSTQFKEILMNGKKFKNLKIIWPEEKIDSYALILGCEKVITFGSTIGFEASFLGKPVISINNKKAKKLNYAYFPKNHKDSLKLIEKKLLAKPKIGSIFFFDYLINGGKKFKFVNTKNNKWYFKDKLIKPNKSVLYYYYFRKIIKMFMNFSFLRIKYLIQNNLLYKKLFLYY